MRGDFTRDVFDPSKHYSRVLAQQGRVLLDDGINAQTAIHLHYLRTLARDLIGPHGGPADALGFELTSLADKDQGPFAIGPGRYYVDGILCENDAEGPVGYSAQPNSYNELQPTLGNHLVYLDVWERHITADQDELLREVALEGPDTTTRAEIVWQVKTHPIGGTTKLTEQQLASIFAELRGVTPQLMARARQEELSEQPCALDPSARYRGLENQLYRVEIHRGGVGEPAHAGALAQRAGRDRQRARSVPQVQQAATEGQATFKWSRDNGAVAVFPVHSESNGGLVLGHLGRDERSGLAEGDWVELTDDQQDRSDQDGRRLQQIVKIDPSANLVTFTDSFGAAIGNLQNPLLRRWDQSMANGPLEQGAIPVVTGDWIDLEDGVQVWFDDTGAYRPGTYWLIPARVATGDVEWPKDDADHPLPRFPDGITHHYAPLYQVTVKAGGIDIDQMHRREFHDLCAVTSKLTFP
jgi:hypothetical protein